MVLLETPKPLSSCDSWSRMSTQARSCWVHVVYASRVPFLRRALLLEAVLIREVNLAVEVLKAGSLAKPNELVSAGVSW